MKENRFLFFFCDKCNCMSGQTMWKTRSSNTRIPRGNSPSMRVNNNAWYQQETFPFVESRKTKAEREEETKWYSREERKRSAVFHWQCCLLSISFFLFFFSRVTAEFCFLSFSSRIRFVLTVLDTITTHNTFIVVPIDIIIIIINIIIIPYVQIDIADERHVIIKLKPQT